MEYCIMQQKDIEKCALTLMKAFKKNRGTKTGHMSKHILGLMKLCLQRYQEGM